MKKTSISVTEAARNFADCVNRAHYQHVTFVLLKNGKPFARLVPDNERVCVGRDLAEVLAKAKLNDHRNRRSHIHKENQHLNRDQLKVEPLIHRNRRSQIRKENQHLNRDQLLMLL